MRGDRRAHSAAFLAAPSEGPGGNHGPVLGALSALEPGRDLAEASLKSCEALFPLYKATMLSFGIADPDSAYLCELIAPLAQFIKARAAERAGPYLVGIGGGPGAGKTTMSGLLARCLHEISSPAADCLSLSIDDFYRSREERTRLGFKWRTLPGTHDTDRISAFVAALDDPAAGPMTVPRYDLGRDAPLPDEVLERRPDICLFDGAMVGSTLPGYACLARRIDFFIYLDLPTSLLRKWRFDRERKLRQSSGGEVGFPRQRMREFWREALGPSIEKWVRPNAQSADLVLEIDAARHVIAARRPKDSSEDRRP